jgi:hypothetical protein
MAFRKTGAKAGAKRPAKRGSYSAGAGGSGYRAGTGAKSKSATRAPRSGGSGVQTVRIVIEQPGMSSAQRPTLAGPETTKPRKSPF